MPAMIRGSSLARASKKSTQEKWADSGIFTSIVDSCDDAIVCKDMTGRVFVWNRAAERLFGYRESEIIGQPVTKLFPPDRIFEERRIMRALRHGHRVEPYQTVRIRKDGRPIDLSVSVSPIHGPGGAIVGACKVARDIAPQVQAESALRRSEQLMRAVLDTAADAIITIDDRGIIRSANAATERMFGYAAAELVGQNVNRLMPEPFATQHDQYVRRYIRTGQARIIGVGREVTGLRKDGSTFPMHLSVSQVRLADRRLFTGIVHDLTERQRLELQIMETAANEQRRIGQDLHDGLCQDLIGIAFGINAMAQKLPPESRPSLSALAASVRDAAGQARLLAHGLNPVDLKAGGLPVALENLAQKISHAFGVDCSFEWDHLATVRRDAACNHLYRIAQEAVTNAIRHGKASRIDIRLAKRNGALTLSISDHGKGMPQSLIDTVRQGLAVSRPPNGSPVGMGLRTMQYRACVVGGTLDVTQRKGGGTTLTCTLQPESIPPAGARAARRRIRSRHSAP
jgi:PAS domain S-box-containing protein